MKKVIALLLALTIMCFTFVACSDKSNEDTENKETETTEQVSKDSVKLTAENLDTYFEFIEESFFTKDGNGNYTQLRYRHYYKLREEYKINPEKSTIKLVYNYSSSTKKVDINFDTQEFTLGEQVGETISLKNMEINKISQLTYKDYAILLLQPTHAKKGDKEIEFLSDFEIVSVEGTLYFAE